MRNNLFVDHTHADFSPRRRTFTSSESRLFPSWKPVRKRSEQPEAYVNGRIFRSRAVIRTNNSRIIDVPRRLDAPYRFYTIVQICRFRTLDAVSYIREDTTAEKTNGFNSFVTALLSSWAKKLDPDCSACANAVRSHTRRSSAEDEAAKLSFSLDAHNVVTIHQLAASERQFHYSSNMMQVGEAPVWFVAQKLSLSKQSDSAALDVC